MANNLTVRVEQDHSNTYGGRMEIRYKIRLANRTMTNELARTFLESSRTVPTLEPAAARRTWQR